MNMGAVRGTDSRAERLRALRQAAGLLVYIEVQQRLCSIDLSHLREPQVQAGLESLERDVAELEASAP